MHTLLLLLLTLCAQSIVHAITIPPKFDGFVYGNRPAFDPDAIIIEAFMDPVCPDSRDSWPPLKRALRHYGSRLLLIVHPFPLPSVPISYYIIPFCCEGYLLKLNCGYHDNAFVTSHALHIVDKLNASATLSMLELFFEQQVVKLVVNVVGNSLETSVRSGFNDRKTDLSTRVSFKYGCSRGVYGTPFFFVNGFVLPDAGDAIDYKGWRKIIDPLVGVHKHKEENYHFFL
ncbi:hypothetical protein Sjap_023742 [Stephania japonica]|uniref:DSBA-like thioredoxin domain-containing protein n=1 Tax=Stephania japonica TaxID=461633 RepID=A0AAP0EC60_9MAGN